MRERCTRACHKMASTKTPPPPCLNDPTDWTIHPAAAFLLTAQQCFSKGAKWSHGAYQLTGSTSIDHIRWGSNGNGVQCSLHGKKFQHLALLNLFDELQEIIDRDGHSESRGLPETDLLEMYKDDFPLECERRFHEIVGANIAGKTNVGYETRLRIYRPHLRRLELWQLARDIGVTRLPAYYRLDTVRLLADKSPAERHSLPEQGQRLLDLIRNDALICSCVIKLLEAPLSSYELLVNEVRYDISLKGSNVYYRDIAYSQMATTVGKLDFEFSESQIRLIEPSFGNVKDLFQGMKRINSIVDTYGVDALEELVTISRHFGTKAEDRGLNVYIQGWINDYLRDFMNAFWIDQQPGFWELCLAANSPYFDAVKWLNRNFYFDVVELGQGIVEAEILEGAVKSIRGQDLLLKR